MYGLLLRAFQSYVSTMFGADMWHAVGAGDTTRAKRFEPLVSNDSVRFLGVAQAISELLRRPVENVLEDLGTYIITNPAQPAPRRLLRFGGASFADFLFSLEELPERASLALPDLCLPRLELVERGPGDFLLAFACDAPGLAHVLVGMIRAMADDYGALILIDAEPFRQDQARIAINLAQTGYSEARRFDLLPGG